jgi:hypothetical protein
VFLGYPSNTKSYLYLDPITKRVYTSRHVLLNETIFPGLMHKPDTSASTALAPISSNTWINTLLSLHICSHNTAVNPCLSSELCPVPIGLSQPSSDSVIPAPNPTQISIPTQPSISLPNSSTILSLPIDIAPIPVSPIESNPTPSPSTSSLPPIPTVTPAPFTTATPAPLVSYPMQTHSKSGIFKPKASYTAQVDSSLTEPTSYTAASNIFSGTLSNNQSGATEAWWAHNPQVLGSKPGSDKKKLPKYLFNYIFHNLTLQYFS